MNILNFIHENPNVLLKDISESLKPKIFNLSFREISNALWHIVIDDSEYEEGIKTRPLFEKDVTEYHRNILLRSLSLESERTVQDALSFFSENPSNHISLIYKEILLSLSFRDVKKGVQWPKSKPESDIRTNKQKVLHLLLDDAECRENFLWNFDWVEKNIHIEIPEKIKKAYEKVQQAKIEFIKSWKEVGLTKEQLKDTYIPGIRVKDVFD